MSGPRDHETARDLPAALHEVGNALTVVVGWIDLALAALPPGAPAAEALEVARGRAARAQRLARRAIGAERDHDPPRRLADVVREVARGVEAARARAVRVEIVVPAALEDASLVRGEAAGQVLTNLVLNAADVSDPGGVVRIEAREGGPGFVTLSVLDGGPGVPDELREALFTGGRSSRPGGAGIGLRHAALLALDVGGELSLAGAPAAPAGDGLGGAAFEVRWPVGGEPERVVDPLLQPDPPSWPPGSALLDSSPPPASSPRSRLDGLRLLLVEDDAAVVDLLEAALSARGASVEVARDRAALGVALGQAPYDAALVDLSPLGDDVPSALGDVRAHSASARLVVISGSVAMSADVPHVDAWVPKPFEIGDVLRALVALR